MFTMFPEGDNWTLLCPDEWKDVAYCVYQLEACPETGRPHFQGYIEFVGKKSFSWIHENCEGLETAHFETRRGNQSDARRYCMKEDTRLEGPWEYGEPKEQVYPCCLCQGLFH